MAENGSAAFLKGSLESMGLTTMPKRKRLQMLLPLLQQQEVSAAPATGRLAQMAMEAGTLGTDEETKKKMKKRRDMQTPSIGEM